jgi:hypothetical protein
MHSAISHNVPSLTSTRKSEGVGYFINSRSVETDPWVKRLMSGYRAERRPSIERNTKARVCHIPIVRENERTAPEDRLLFLQCLDVLPPYGGGRFTQSECPLGQLQIVCRKPHQMFGHARLSTLLCESYAPFG